MPSTPELPPQNPSDAQQSLAQAHADFVSVISHEFRTPLTSIKGFADTLLRYGNKLPPEQQTKFITIIKDQADRLTRMVENLLIVSKQGHAAHDLVFRAIPLAKLLDKVIQNVLAKANAASGSPNPLYHNRVVEVSLRVPPQTDVWGDPDTVEQILTNLIDNALKYSVIDTPVQIDAAPFHSEDLQNAFELRVTNQGIGIEPEQLDKVFAKFSRIDNPLTRQVEGTGLGLYITKQMVESLGGQIGVESVPNATTTFWVRLPMATPERQDQYHKAQGAFALPESTGDTE